MKSALELPADSLYSIPDIALADINGDSLPDLVVLRANYGGFYNQAYGDEAKSILLPTQPYSAPIVIQYEVDVFLNNGSATPFADTPTETFSASGPTPPSPYVYLALGNPRLALVDLSVPGTGVLSILQNLDPLAPGVNLAYLNRTPQTDVSFTASPTSDPAPIDFVDAEHQQAGGVVYSDTNRNGLQDSLDTPVAGAIVYSDENGNGVLDPGEPSAVTNAAGAYSLSGLTPGQHTLRVDAGTSMLTTSTPNEFLLEIPDITAAASTTSPPSTTYNFGVAPRLLADFPSESITPGQTLTVRPTQSAAAAPYDLNFRLTSNVPAGATIDPSTGLVTWTPSSAVAPGRYPLLVQTYDLNNAFATETVTLDVDVAAAPPQPAVAMPAIQAAPAAPPVMPLRRVLVSLTPPVAHPGAALKLRVNNPGPGRATFELSLAGPAARYYRLAQTQVTLDVDRGIAVAILPRFKKHPPAGSLRLIGVVGVRGDVRVRVEAAATVVLPLTEAASGHIASALGRTGHITLAAEEDGSFGAGVEEQGVPCRAALGHQA